MRNRYVTAICCLVLVGVLSVGTYSWLFLGDSEVLAEDDCKDADPVTSYDITVTWDDPKAGGNIKGTNAIENIRVQGKMNHVHSTWTEGGRDLSSDEIYDGDGTVYRRQEWTETYEQDKSDRYPSIMDISAEPFPYGKQYLCPDIDALGAEYQDTDSTGKRYRIEAEKTWDTLTFWTDEDGWLVRAEVDEASYKVTISGIGENNAIAIPPPPYRPVGSLE